MYKKKKLKQKKKKTKQQTIGIEFWIEKYVMVIMKKGRTGTTKEIELPNQESVRTLRDKKISIIW